MSNKPAVLALADGTVFHGVSWGCDGSTTGEVVFNTAMSGYQEILTDPSYHSQFVTFTYPHIGNVGINPADQESSEIHLSGIVTRELPRTPSNWRSRQSLPEWMNDQGRLAMAGVDTRRLTRLLRDKGAQNACMICGDDANEAEALRQAAEFPGLVGMDLAKVVTTDTSYGWSDTVWSFQQTPAPKAKFHVVVLDLGVKQNILRLLVAAGCRVTVVPAQTSVEELLACQPDGVMLSNGPGDPEPCDYAIATAKALLAKKTPIMGICLGHQILSLALGAKTKKMKFGHHGANHPVQDLESSVVHITSQNHGFCADEATLPNNVKATHRSLFDGSLQGIECTDAPAFGFQGHPEASPGPHDILSLFDRFIAMMEASN